jgi:hypothetical protein
VVGNTIVVNVDGFADVCYLWYQKRAASLHCGTADAGGAGSLSLETAMYPSNSDDHYNDVYIEAVSGTGAPTIAQITDYAASGHVCTLDGGSFDDDTVYGTFSDLPEEAQLPLILETTLLCLSKPSTSPDPNYYQMLRDRVKDARSDFESWIATWSVGSGRVIQTEI